jgi:Flp pilus assembly pilin Flp
MLSMRLFRDERAVTAIEFAVISPAMLFLICSAIEIGHMAFTRIALEGAVTEAARVATASLETNEQARTQIMRASITRTMASFPLAHGQSVSIHTRVFRDFSTAHPEPYNDANNNRSYDLGEAFTDRNANGRWDPATQIAGTLGGPGDVVSVTATFPKRILFGFLAHEWALGTSMNLHATTVVRNEAVVRRSS